MDSSDLAFPPVQRRDLVVPPVPALRLLSAHVQRAASGDADVPGFFLGGVALLPEVVLCGVVVVRNGPAREARPD